MMASTDDMSAGQELSAPLLGSQEERELDEEDGCMGCTVSIMLHDDDEEAEEEDDNIQEFSWFDQVVVWIILPTLLFLQFGMAFYMSDVEAVTGLRWTVVNYSIVLFVVTAVLFRQAAIDCKWTHSLIILLPEILMDVILGMVLFDKIVMAFLFMIFSMLSLAMFVVVCSIRVLIVLSMNEASVAAKEAEAIEHKEAETKAAQEKPIVSLFQGGRVPDTQTK
jgi:hypothetical protein